VTIATRIVVKNTEEIFGCIGLMQGKIMYKKKSEKHPRGWFYFGAIREHVGDVH